ncbi:MAG TPA: M48 family metallopeptidase [Caulobacterales bacterium]|nr:M48 family metallopeptidase [Caulobacterales bacterium]
MAGQIHPVSRRALLGGAAAGAALLAAGCETNPATGRQQLILIDESQLQQAALQAWAQQRAQTPAWNNRAAQARLERVGLRIAQGAGRGAQQWEFVLFDTPEKNAFVLPGNHVGFYRGLYEICDVDDYMATVLGHETGHVVARHAAERYSREMATQTALQVAGSRVNSQVAMAALGLGAQVGLSLPFSREQESEADRLGINFMHAAGFDVKQAIPFWNRMAASGGSRPTEILSTHPDPVHRIADIRAYINAQGWGPA